MNKLQQSCSFQRRNQAPKRQCCFSFAAYARALMDHLRRCGVRVEPGLSEMELGHVEAEFGFVFPPDLRAILQEGLPVSPSFPDWRSASGSWLRARIQQPVSEVVSEIRKNRLWSDKWGPRPMNDEEAITMAAGEMKKVPVLVPVHGNCFIPATESTGNPVLLVQSGEVSVFGNDISDFFEKEVFHSEEQDSEDLSIQSACLMGSLMNIRSKEHKSGVDGILSAFRKKKTGNVFSRAIREISRSAEVSPRPSVSSAQQQDPPRRSFDFIFRPRKSNATNKDALLGYTMAAPAWTAKKPKNVEFWSDLCESPKQDIETVSGRRSDFGCYQIGGSASDAARVSDVGCSQIQPISSEQIRQQDGHARTGQRWLDGYLDDMAGRLRTAGWKEDEISEMVDSNSDSCERASSAVVVVPRQAVIQGLVSKVHELSDSLKRSGWSVQDVAEAFNASNLSVWASSSAIAAR